MPIRTNTTDYISIYASLREAKYVLRKLREAYWSKEFLTVEEFDYITNSPNTTHSDKRYYGWTSLKHLKTFKDERGHYHIEMTKEPIFYYKKELKGA